jgi:hypothetical protein
MREVQALQQETERLARGIARDRLPPDAGAIGQLTDIVQRAFDAGTAYVLGPLLGPDGPCACKNFPDHLLQFVIRLQQDARGMAATAGRLEEDLRALRERAL